MNKKFIKRISFLFIFHQILAFVWMLLFSRRRIYESTVVITVLLAITLTTFAIITNQFRYKQYQAKFADYFCIEVPFALLLGWELAATLISYSIAGLALTSNEIIPFRVQPELLLACAIISFMVIVVAAVLFAGLPMLMDPVVHIPLLWATGTIGYRWVDPALLPNFDPVINAHVLRGISYSAFGAAVIVGIFFIVAAAIFFSSNMCCAQPYASSDPSISPRRNSSLSDGDSRRSPRTARSALTGERV